MIMMIITWLIVLRRVINLKIVIEDKGSNQGGNLNGREQSLRHMILRGQEDEVQKKVNTTSIYKEESKLELQE